MHRYGSLININPSAFAQTENQRNASTCKYYSALGTSVQRNFSKTVHSITPKVKKFSVYNRIFFPFFKIIFLQERFFDTSTLWPRKKKCFLFGVRSLICPDVTHSFLIFSCFSQRKKEIRIYYSQCTKRRTFSTEYFYCFSFRNVEICLMMIITGTNDHIRKVGCLMAS